MNRHPAARRDVVGDRGGLAELVLAGLVAEADEDEVLGDLAEGRALCAAAQGERPARRWYRRQVLRALPPLVLHGLKTRPWFVVLGALGALTVTALVEWGVDLGGSYDSRLSLEPRDVLVGTIWRGAALLLAGAVGGAVAAWLARGARLVSVISVAAFWSLWAWAGPFYAVFGPGVLVSGSASQPGYAEYTVDLSATSDQLVIPALWQLPTMAVAMPAMTMLGGLAAVHWLRRRARGPAALASGGS
jgi:hypothetical protein